MQSGGAQAASLLVSAACRNNLLESDLACANVLPAGCRQLQAGSLRSPNPKTEKEMPDRASLAIRHLVGVSNQTKAELCVTRRFL